MASGNDDDAPNGRSHWPISLSVGGIVTTIALVVTLQANLATVEQVDELRDELRALDSEGSRGLSALRAEIRGDVASLRERIDDRTDDRFRGKDFERENRTQAVEIQRLHDRITQQQAEIDRLREFVTSLDRQLRGGQP